MLNDDIRNHRELVVSGRCRTYLLVTSEARSEVFSQITDKSENERPADRRDAFEKLISTKYMSDLLAVFTEW